MTPKVELELLISRSLIFACGLWPCFVEVSLILWLWLWLWLWLLVLLIGRRTFLVSNWLRNGSLQSVHLGRYIFTSALLMLSRHWEPVVIVIVLVIVLVIVVVIIHHWVGLSLLTWLWLRMGGTWRSDCVRLRCLHPLLGLLSTDLLALRCSSGQR